MVFSVASLLIQLRSGEKRQRGRWPPGRGHQEVSGRGFLFFLAKMSQDSVESLPRFTGYDVLILNATVRRSDDDFQRSATATADLNIDGKNAFQALGPGHRRVTLSR